LDYITFSGAGEPTLNSSIKQIIRYIKETYPQYKLALLTNGTLLNRDDVLMEILPCDVILPSLDAASNEIYQKVNRPHPSLNIDDLIDGLIELRKLYNGEIWLEVFIVPNVTDTAQELDRLRSAIARISPDLVQLNSLDRPGAEEWVRAADPQRLKQIRSYMQEGLSIPVDIIAKIEYQPEMDVLDTDLVDIIKSTISRRPSTVEDLAASLGIHINEISRVMRELNKQGKLKTERKPQGVFYKWIA
jgi:wyosine [tRNA(Phe)-imidazoG37] synthetase (radical SAM superfamily)